jgi:hypothetical protein
MESVSAQEQDLRDRIEELEAIVRALQEESVLLRKMIESVIVRSK